MCVCENTGCKFWLFLPAVGCNSVITLNQFLEPWDCDVPSSNTSALLLSQLAPRKSWGFGIAPNKPLSSLLKSVTSLTRVRVSPQRQMPLSSRKLSASSSVENDHKLPESSLSPQISSPHSPTIHSLAHLSPGSLPE